MFRLALISRCVGLSRRLRRLVGSQPADLDTVEQRRTISDCLDGPTLSHRLPTGWQPAVEIVQFRGQPVAETVRLTNQRDGSRITLKPLAVDAPSGPIELHTRAAATAERTHHATEPSLSAGVTEAIRLAASHTPTRRRLTARSSSHRQPPTPPHPDGS